MSAEDASKYAEKDPSSARLIITLSLAGFLSGLILVGVYEVTLPTITANKARELREAVFKVLPGVERMEAMAWINESLQVSEGDGEDSEIPTVYAGYDSEDALVGYAVPADGPGFQDTIRLLYGYKPDERLIVGMEVLDSRETPGLGDKIFKDQAFRDNFNALAVDPEVVAVKTGTKTEANQVDTITGATISSKAVVNIINTTNQQWLSRLEPKKESARARPPDGPPRRERKER